MAKTDLKIKSNDNQKGTSITTSVTYVNPEANSNTLKQLGQKLNALTTNNYVQSDRVQTINVDTEEIAPQQGTLEIVDNPTFTRESFNILIPVTNFILNGQPMTEIPANSFIFGRALRTGGVSYAIDASSTTNSVNIMQGTDRATIPTGEYQLTIAVKETANRTAATTTKTITIT